MAAPIVTAPFIQPAVLVNANGTLVSDGVTLITNAATAPFIKPGVLVNSSGTPI